MKYCTKCGACVNDTAVFCQQCGSAIEVSPAAMSAAQAAPAAPQTAAVPVSGRSILAKAASGVLFLIAVIAQTAYVAFSIINSVAAAVTSTDATLKYVQLALLAVQAAPVAACVFLWLLRAKARGCAQGAPLSPRIYRSLKICNIFYMINSFLTALLPIGLGIFCFGISSWLSAEGNMQEILDMHIPFVSLMMFLPILGVMLLLGGVLGIAAAVVYRVFSIKMCNAAAEAARTDAVPRYTSMLVPIFNFIIAGSLLLVLFSGVWAALAGLCGIAAQIMMGIIMLQYRSACRNAAAPSLPR